MAADHMISPTPPRILPPITDLDRPFWTGGADGHLLIQRCVGCRRWTHPPTTSCPVCRGALQYEPVRGTGTILTFTVDHQQYHPQVPPPYVIAIVVLDEQDDLRLVTNIVGADAEALACGHAVRVLFERHGDHHVPVFELIPDQITSA